MNHFVRAEASPVSHCACLLLAACLLPSSLRAQALQQMRAGTHDSPSSSSLPPPGNNRGPPVNLQGPLLGVRLWF